MPLTCAAVILSQEARREHRWVAPPSLSYRKRVGGAARLQEAGVEWTATKTANGTADGAE